MPARLDAGTLQTTPRCSPRYPQDPMAIETPPVEPGPPPVPTRLTAAAAWSRSVDALGAYAHGVAFDAGGHVIWAHDTKNMHFAVERFDRDGQQQWQRILEPRQLEPQALHANPDGTIVVAGTSFADGPAGGQRMVKLEPTQEERWHQQTPRVSVHALAGLPDGHTLMLGSSGRQEVTLGGHVLRNEWLPRGHSMDVVARLDDTGEYVWSTAYFPGALGLAVQGDAFYLAGNFGREAVDYGTSLGPTEGPGVLARFELASGHATWAVSLPSGLRTVLPHGDDVLAVGFGAGTPAAWFDASGCYRGSVSLGEGISRIVAGPDGSLVVYGMTPTWPEIVAIGAMEFEILPSHWFVARIDPELKLSWLHELRCDGLQAAAGPHGRAAISCYTDEHRINGNLVRRYDLYVLGE